jgi:hypothetical protein
MQEIYFLVRHAPFWGIPLLILGSEFAYMFWLRKKKKSAFIYLTLAIIGLSTSSFYFWAGGPEKSVKMVKKFYRDYKN